MLVGWSLCPESSWIFLTLDLGPSLCLLYLHLPVIQGQTRMLSVLRTSEVLPSWRNLSLWFPSSVVIPLVFHSVHVSVSPNPTLMDCLLPRQAPLLLPLAPYCEGTESMSVLFRRLCRLRISHVRRKTLSPACDIFPLVDETISSLAILFAFLRVWDLGEDIVDPCWQNPRTHIACSVGLWQEQAGRGHLLENQNRAKKK